MALLDDAVERTKEKKRIRRDDDDDDNDEDDDDIDDESSFSSGRTPRRIGNSIDFSPCHGQQAKSSDGKSHAPIITLRTKTASNSSLKTNVGAGMNDCLSLQSLSGRSLMHLMSEESLTSLGITDEDLSYDWMAGHYDEDNPNIPEATSSSCWRNIYGVN